MKSSETKKKVTRKTEKKKTGDKCAAPVSGCGCCGKCVGDDATDAFIREVTEDVQNDNLKVLWNKYGLFIILFVVLAVSAAVGFETIRSWREQKYQARTEEYISAVQPTDNQELGLKALEKIAQADKGIYSELAKVQIANILFEQNKADEAQNLLQSVIDNAEKGSRVHNLAALKLATYKIDTAPREDLLSLLNPVAESDSAWSPLAKDLLAMVAIRDGDIDTAREIYTSLLNNANLSENFKSRIQDMLSALNGM